MVSVFGTTHHSPLTTHHFNVFSPGLTGPVPPDARLPARGAGGAPGLAGPAARPGGGFPPRPATLDRPTPPGRHPCERPCPPVQNYFPRPAGRPLSGRARRSNCHTRPTLP